MIVIANVFPKLQTVKNLLGPLSKKRGFRRHFDSQHVKASEIQNIHDSTFNMFFHHSQGSLFGKCLP